MNLTSLYIFAILNGILLLTLTLNVVRLRIKHKIAYQDGGNNDLLKAIRVHANSVEQVPIFGFLVLALCFAQANPTWLMVLVIAFSASRVTHAYGMLYKQIKLRQLGMVVTAVCQLLAIVMLVVTLI